MKFRVLSFGFRVLATIFLFQKTGAAQDVFQLAPPILVYENRFFDKKMVVEVKFAMDGTQIRFTLDGSEPTEKSAAYRSPIVVKRNGTTLRARVFGAGFLPSETVGARFFKKGLPVKNLSQTPPDPKYPGHGERTLTDGKAATADTHDPGWQGFQADTVRLGFVFEKTEKVRRLALDVLQNQSAWVFLPQRVAVFSKKPGSGELLLLAEKDFPAAENDPETACRTLVLDFPKTKADGIVVKIWPLARIPDWHAGRGARGWLFLDEVNFY